MGKKSKRRTGKRNKQKAASICDEATKKGEESLRQQVDDVLTFASFDTLANLSNIEEEQFYEFMIWSLVTKSI
ncbi:predicted protein [Chaetoceros tenuissimus]|uniref:Uncharacterized protein n=1 Tax=Chaetoceros tenuissimus TaxID=426638 RepID=A0AAD3CR97_9STRA|nr:predicted protein [Chaetoceros tenuissimus]